MRRVIVRYRLKPDKVEQHLALVRAVFDELAQTRPTGMRYAAVRAPDGVSFTHIAAFDTDANPLGALASFKEFQREIGARCDEPPAPIDVTVVGDYGLFR